jgi:hypothetical protein
MTNSVLGERAAVALVTSVRSLHDSPLANSKQLRDLFHSYVEELSPDELVNMTYALVIMAANPMDDEDLRLFAVQLLDEDQMGT